MNFVVEDFKGDILAARVGHIQGFSSLELQESHACLFTFAIATFPITQEACLSSIVKGDCLPLVQKLKQ